MKFKFEGSTEEFLTAFGQILIDSGIEPNISQELIARDRGDDMIAEAINIVSNVRQAHVNRGNFISQLQALIRDRNRESRLRGQWEALAREAMLFVDRQIGGVTTEMSLSHRLTELEQCIKSNLMPWPLHQGANSEVPQSSPRTDESQTASEGADTPAYVFESGVDPL